MSKTEFRIVSNPDTKKFDVVEVVKPDLETEDAAKEAVKQLELEDGDIDADAQELAAETTEDEAEQKTEDNPHGLDIHQRFSALLKTLSKAGIKHNEANNPAQHPNTANVNFARKPDDGQNALSVDEKRQDVATPATEK